MKTLFAAKWIHDLVWTLASAMLFIFISAGGANCATELAHVNFDNDISGQPPSTGGPGEPTFLISQPGTSILVQASANGIFTQPVVLSVPDETPFASVSTLFDPVAEGVVRIEATVALDRLADGYFLQTVAGSGSFPTAVVTRLIMRDFGQIQDDVTRTQVGTYAPNQPFKVRMDIDMSRDEWSVAIDDELNGFEDDAVVSNLPFSNPITVVPTVGGIATSLNLFPTLSVAPTAIAYDDILALLLVVSVDIDIKPGNNPNSINPRSKGVIPVAILTTEDFDATTVDSSETFFGPTGTEAPPMQFSLEDVDGDGDTDMILHFETQATGIQCSDVSVLLRGITYDDQEFEGTDSINPVGCE